MTFSFYQVCLILGQLVRDPLVSKQSENFHMVEGGKWPYRWGPFAGPESKPKDFTVINSRSPRARKFTKRRFHRGRFQPGETTGPHTSTKPGLQAALGVAAWALPPGVVPAPCHSSNLRVKSSSGSRTEHFCQRPEASKKKKVLFQSRFLFFRVCLLPLTLCPQPPCLPFPNAPPLSTLKKKKKKKKKKGGVFPLP